MKIEKLSECSVKITLSKSDLSDYNISYDSWDSDITADFLLSVSDDIKATTGKDISNEKLYVEIFSRTSGCQIFISYPPAVKAIKNTTCCIVYDFTEYSSLKRFCKSVNRDFSKAIKDSALYYSNTVLRLIISTSVSYKDYISESAERCLISECDEIAFSSTSEYYTCVLSKNAVKQIASN